MQTQADGSEDFGTPLRWLVHGGPGTGKSHVITQVKKLFHDVVNYEIGVRYQVVALQAVTASLLGGDTIHHACGISFKKKDVKQDENQEQRQKVVAERVLQLEMAYYR